MSRVWFKNLTEKGRSDLIGIRRSVVREAALNNVDVGYYSRKIDGRAVVAVYRCMPDYDELQQAQLIILDAVYDEKTGHLAYVRRAVADLLFRMASGDVKILHKEIVRHSLASVEFAA